MKDYSKFISLLGTDLKRPTKAVRAQLESDIKNWLDLHPKLAELKPNEKSLETLVQYMEIEFSREAGPRPHIVDRLYKRYSNLRREIETSVLISIVPSMSSDEPEEETVA